MKTVLSNIAQTWSLDKDYITGKKNQEHMDEIRSQLWVKRVENAFLELNPKRLIERIETAETAIDGRIFDLRNDSDHHEERSQMADAQRTLKTLRQME